MISGRFIRCAAAAGLILAAVGAPGAAWAQAPLVTGVTGTLQAGATLSIAGSGFGLKTVAAPLKFDNFESGAPGSTIGNGWARSASANSPGTPHPPDYSTAVLRPNSTRSVRCRFDEATAPPGCDTAEDGCQYESSFGVSGNPAQTGYTPGVTLPVLYLDAWMYYATATPAPRNFKPFRIHTNTYTPNLYYGMWCPASSDGSIVGASGGIDGQWLPDPPKIGSAYYSGNWRHLQFYIVESSPNVKDGTVLLTVDNVLKVNRVRNFMTRTSSGSHYDTFWIGNYAGHGQDAQCAGSPGNTYVYWDDAYVDTTRAHVEIGDAPTYSACTHREIQVPTLWTPAAIAIKANPGSFASLANMYLYVIDRNGAVNSTGYRLVTGGGGDILAPATVGDLRPKTGS
jgi:hypothetical protein